jgi:hypothetical protein
MSRLSYPSLGLRGDGEAGKSLQWSDLSREGARRADEGEPCARRTRTRGKEHRPSRALTICWALLLVTYAATAIWLFSHPPALSSDDALFFAHGLTRFSILDFSPQFPGYPGFIAMGRLLLPLADESTQALALLTTLLALALPPLAALVVRRNGRRSYASLAAFALVLAMPLIPDLALSLLSDGAGIVFLLVGLLLLPRRGEAPHRLASLLAGATLAWAAACRPSDAALLLGGGIGALLVCPRLFSPAAFGFLAVAVPVLGTLLLLEPLYFSEGLRFTTGHALIWGNTPFSPQHADNWLTAIAAQPGGPEIAALLLIGVVAALPGLRRRPPALAAAVFAFLAHAIWIALFQNPDSLRHLAPLLVLGVLILVLVARYWHRVGPAVLLVCLALELGSTLASVNLSPTAIPPLDAAANWLATQPRSTAVATNEGVFLLRDRLPSARVFDEHYPADAALGLATATGPAFRLTSTPTMDKTPAAVFPSRFAGEHTLWVYQSWAGH